ncbi:MAG: hypothetical protein LUC32_08170 [Clostridiales bacterium]|nr:hypothetical protein [Clostridiales bacterium]
MGNVFDQYFTYWSDLPAAWLRYPTVNYMNLHGFLSHGILVLFAVLVLIWLFSALL